MKDKQLRNYLGVYPGCNGHFTKINVGTLGCLENKIGEKADLESLNFANQRINRILNYLGLEEKYNAECITLEKINKPKGATK